MLKFYSTDMIINVLKAKFLLQSKSFSKYGDNLNFVRKDNPKRIIIVLLNINSLRNKFDSLMSKIKNDIDILMISETKLDDSIPIG